ncbi:MAG: hypothetical protein WAN40_02565, partial [Thermoplasmata archaeon]
PRRVKARDDRARAFMAGGLGPIVAVLDAIGEGSGLSLALQALTKRGQVETKWIGADLYYRAK